MNMSNMPTTGMSHWPKKPMLGTGQVRHARLRPAVHRFAYRACFLWLPVRTLVRQPELLAQSGLNGPWLGFRPDDHGDGQPTMSQLLQWMDDLLQAHGISDADGEVWLQCFPRTLGHAFKPVSFWHALRADGSLRATVAEVNNTFGERHCYILDHPRWGQTQLADKSFHVSPFCQVNGQYTFRFMSTQGEGGFRSVARVDHASDGGPLLETSISGTALPATPTMLRQAFWQHPAQSLVVVARIHWHALRLWIKGVTIHTKPEPPAIAVTLAGLAPGQTSVPPPTGPSRP